MSALRNTVTLRTCPMNNVTPEPLVINDTNLSRAWARTFLRTLENPGTEISPLVLSLSGFNTDGTVNEDAGVRGALDALLTDMDYWDIETVAFTIFPQRYWTLAGGDRAKLFAIYRDAFPRIQAMNPRNNRRGLYFERLMMYGRGPCSGNQLEWILSQYEDHTSVRRSMLQATTFDPERDHIPDAQLGFPCLQHVTFVPSRAGLVVNAFYATQQLFDKAYGNYLGLAQLGAFMAHEMELPLARVNVNIGIAKLDRPGKTDSKLAGLISAARMCVEAATAVPLSGRRAAAEFRV
jgi:hypothetical protein